MLSGHETVDFTGIQIPALIITDHNSANYYLAEFFVKQNTYKIEPFDFKKGQNRVFNFLSPEKRKNHMEPL